LCLRRLRFLFADLAVVRRGALGHDALFRRPLLGLAFAGLTVVFPSVEQQMQPRHYVVDQGKTPGGPGGPASPRGPGLPCSPCAPRRPWLPIAPGLPRGPAGPGRRGGPLVLVARACRRGRAGLTALVAKMVRWPQPPPKIPSGDSYQTIDDEFNSGGRKCVSSCP